MIKSLLGEKIAVLVANGFHEKDLTEIQRGLQKMGANIRIISMDHGLVGSWDGEGWGLHFAADKQLSGALAADFSALIVPGGQRSVEKLKLTAHTKRFMSGFLGAGKPVILFDDALELLIFAEKTEGRAVTGPAGMRDDLTPLGAEWVHAPYAIDQNLMTGGEESGAHDDYIAAALEFLAAQFTMSEAA